MANLTESERAQLEKAITALGQAQTYLRRFLDQADEPDEPGPVDPGPVDPPGKPDWQVYLDRYADVRKAGPYTEAWAERHYRLWGKREGRVWGEPDEGAAVGGRRFHHFNPKSWDGRGTSVVLCPGDKASKVTLNGKALRKHSNLDKGREVWTDYNTPGQVGELAITIGSVTYVSRMTNASSMTDGDCG